MDYQKNTKQMFLCLQTQIRDCDPLVTLFILCHKSSKRKLCLIQSSISITQNQKYALHSRKCYCQWSHWLRLERLCKQLIILVNRLGHVQLNGKLEKKMALMKLEDIVQQEDAMATEFCDDKIISKKKLRWKFIALWWRQKLRWKKFVMKT